MLRNFLILTLAGVFIIIFISPAKSFFGLEFKKQDIDAATKDCDDASPCKPELVPTIDEDGNINLALLEAAKPNADSLIAGWCPQRHCTEYLNDGFYNNCRSWISATSPGQEAWGEIDLGGVYFIFRIGFGSDHCGNYNDRAATDSKILTATKYDADSKAATWKEVYDNKNGDQVTETTYFDINPVDARFVRISVMNTSGSQVRIDEIEIYTTALAVDAKDKMAICWGSVKREY